jgi:hypothetical protein
MIVDNELAVNYAVVALQQRCNEGVVGPAEARVTLAAFGGIPHRSLSGAELFLFVGTLFDVEVMTSTSTPERCILWKTMTPD